MPIAIGPRVGRLLIGSALALAPGACSTSDSEPELLRCAAPSDCPSGNCRSNGICASATPPPVDGAQNGDETDVDCGGSAAKCETNKRCQIADDCQSGVCLDKGQGVLCQEPAPDDGVKNGDESDVDCGGARAPKCADGKACKARGDCTSDVCNEGACAVPSVDGVQNGSETDVDCGGSSAPRCDDLKNCLVAEDCASGVCKDAGSGAGVQCQVPTPTDGVKNGDESDVDCGGAKAPKCAVGQGCVAHADCSSDGCAYDGKCALRRSCTRHEGGDTCGLGGAGGTGAAQWESCCVTAPAGGVQLDKYKVTSGRMRAFMERTNGNVRQFIRDARAAGKIPAGATMPASYELFLPTAMDGCEQNGTCQAEEIADSFSPYAGGGAAFVGLWSSAYRHLGGSLFNGQSLPTQGCRIDSPGSHTYWMDAATQAQYFGDKPAEHSQAIYDAKPLNCVNYLMAQAFCIWDGGRLETFAERLAAWGPGAMPWGAGPSPWGPGTNSYFGNRYPTAGDATIGAPPGPVPAGSSIEWATYQYSYEYPNLASTDFVVFHNAPGRMKGRGPAGHADVVGDMMEITSDVANSGDPRSSTMYWTSNGSFEGHQWSKAPVWYTFTLVNKHGKQGLRCAY